jgi:hypothetical protein
MSSLISVAPSKVRSSYSGADPFRPDKKIWNYTIAQRAISANFLKRKQKSLLLFHGIGTGKTCAALQVISIFILNNPGRYVHIIVPSKSLEKQWKNVLTPTQNIENTCLTPQIINNNKFIQIILKSTIQKHSKDFAKTKTKMGTDLYENSLIVIDEIHMNFFSDDTINKTPLNPAPSAIVHLTKKYNIRILGLTATPTYDSYPLAFDIINFLRKCDGKTHIKIDENNFSENAAGYISYVRGDNPLTYPVRLSPSNNTYPSRGLIDERIKIKLSDIQVTELKKLNKNAPMTTIQHINTCVQGPDDWMNYNNLQKYSPKFKFIIDVLLNNQNMAGGGKYCKYFKNKKRPTCKQTNFGPSSFECSKTPNPSTGYCRIVNKPNKTKKTKKTKHTITNSTLQTGIIIIAFQFNESWKSFVKVLDANGFYNIKKSNKPFMNYVTPDKIDTYLKLIRSERNKNGEKIRIALLMPRHLTGLDFKNIRQIHLVETWWNIEFIQQAVGRGFRRNSHVALEPKEQNIIVYQYSTYHDTIKNYKLTEENKFNKISEKLNKSIQIIKLLKQSAIDCKYQLNNTNDNYNLATIKKFPVVIDVLGVKRLPLYNSKFTEQIKCDYDDNLYEPPPNNTMINNIIDIIVGVIRIYPIPTVQQLIIFTKLLAKTSTETKYQEVQFYDDLIILNAIIKMVQKRIPVVTSEGISGLFTISSLINDIQLHDIIYIKTQGQPFLYNRTPQFIRQNWFKYVIDNKPKGSIILTNFNNDFKKWVITVQNIKNNSYQFIPEIIDALIDRRTSEQIIELYKYIIIRQNDIDLPWIKSIIKKIKQNTNITLFQNFNIASNIITYKLIYPNRFIEIKRIGGKTWSPPTVQNHGIGFINYSKVKKQFILRDANSLIVQAYDSAGKKNRNTLFHDNFNKAFGDTKRKYPKTMELLVRSGRFGDYKFIQRHELI